MTVLPRSRRCLSVARRRALSRWCRPIEGSSSTYMTPVSPEPIWLASRMRCASPPESVSAPRSRSEERREGKSVDLGGRRIIKKKKKKKEEQYGKNKKNKTKNKKKIKKKFNH